MIVNIIEKKRHPLIFLRGLHRNKKKIKWEHDNTIESKIKKI